MAAIVNNGYADGGMDWGSTIFQTYNDLNVSGVNGYALVKTGQNYINFSGVTGGKVVVALDNTYGRPRFEVIDTFGGAAGTNIVISGAPGASGWLFNGASTYTLSTAYGRANFVYVTGVIWNVK